MICSTWLINTYTCIQSTKQHKCRSVVKEQTDHLFLSGGEAVPLLSLCNHQVLGMGCQCVSNNCETQSTNSSINRDNVFKAASPLPKEVPYPLLIEAIDCGVARDIFSASLEKMEIHTITIIQHCDYYISIMDDADKFGLRCFLRNIFL